MAQDNEWWKQGATAVDATAPAGDWWKQGATAVDGQSDRDQAAPGLIPTIKRTGGQMLTTAATTLEDVTGPNAATQAMRETGQGIIDRNPAGITSLRDVVDSPWLTVKESVGQFVPQIGAAAAGGLAGARLGGAVGALAGPAGAGVGAAIGGVAGGLLPIFAQEYGGIRQEQKEAGQEDKARALAAAVPATALERVGMGKALKVLNGVPGGAASTVLKEAGKGVIKEGATEGAQNVIEQWGAFQDPTTGESLEGTALAAIMGGIGGGVVGAGTGAVDGARRKAAANQPAGDAPAQPEAEPAPLLLGNTPDPLVQFPDGTVGRRSEVEAYIAGLPEEQQTAARAALYGYAPQPAEVTTSPGAADPGAAQQQPMTMIEALQAETALGAQAPRDGIDFTREFDDGGLTLEDPAEIERARAATIDYEPTPVTPQWDTAAGAAPERQPGLDMPAPEFDTGGLELDTRTPSQQMGIEPAAGPLSRVAAQAVDTQAAEAGPAEAARQSGAQAFAAGVPREQIAAIPNVIHQWLAKRANGEAVKVIRLHAPIQQVLAQVAQFPSTMASGGAASTTAPTTTNAPELVAATADAQRAAASPAPVQTAARQQDRPSAPAPARETGRNSAPALTGQAQAATKDVALQEHAVMFSRSADTRAAYEARIDALFAGGKAERVGVKVLDRSDVLSLLGYADQPVVLAEGKVLQGRDNHPRMTAQAWKKIPEWLENPAAVFASDTVEGRLVFVAPEMVGGSPVRLIVEPNTQVGGLQVHMMLNAFDASGRTPWMRWAGDGLARYIDKKKFPAILAPSGLQLSRVEQVAQGTGRILSEKHLVGYRRANDPAFSFGGQQAVTADRHALASAQQRLEAGEDAEAVRRDTGWYQGADGKWRFEISDADAMLTADTSGSEGRRSIGQMYPAYAFEDDGGLTVGKMLHQVALQSGLIDQAAYELMREQPYVPFYRLMEDGGDVQGPRFSAGLVNQQAWKKLKGGTQQINHDLLHNMLLNWGSLYAASARNRAALEALGAADGLGIAHRVPADTKGAVQVRRAGVAESWMVEDPHLMDAITAMSYTPGVLASALAPFKRVLTMAVTINPTFKVRNLIRDSLSAMAQSELGYNPLANVVQGWKALDKDSQTHASMLASGGIIRFGTLEDSGKARRQVEKLGGQVLDQKGWKKLTGQLQSLWSVYEEIGDKSENANRAALYEQLIAKGHSHAEASFMARDLMDFSMSGQWEAVRFLAQTVPFLNARLQGLYKLGRAAHQDPKKFAIVTGAVASASLALLWASYQAALKSGDVERAQAIRESEGETLARRGIVQGSKTRLAELSLQARRIEADRAMTAAEKRERLDAIAALKDRAARTAAPL